MDSGFYKKGIVMIMKKNQILFELRDYQKNTNQNINNIFSISDLRAYVTFTKF